VHRLRAGATSLAAATIILLPTPAFADSPWGKVNCDRTPTAPQCTVTVVDPGNAGNSAGGGSGPLVCRFGTQVVDCYNQGFGWYGGDGCYYGKDAFGFLPAQVWIKRCLDAATGNITDQGTVLLLDPPATLAAMLRRAVSQLRIPAPAIAASPSLNAPQVVQVPVWWWVQPRSWQTQTATASLPGITITARATPETTTWDAGDGTSTVCTGAGTPWMVTYAPTAPSPTCGHTYTTTSRTNPGGKFTLRATITWTITWSGGGMTGTEPAIATRAVANIDVTELRAVIRS
jgi:hypothetical protein